MCWGLFLHIAWHEVCLAQLHLFSCIWYVCCTPCKRFGLNISDQTYISILVNRPSATCRSAISHSVCSKSTIMLALRLHCHHVRTNLQANHYLYIADSSLQRRTSLREALRRLVSYVVKTHDTLAHTSRAIIQLDDIHLPSQLRRHSG